MGTMLLGELAVRKGLATESEIETALDLQKAGEDPAPKVGEILIGMGTFSESDLQSLLLEQTSLRGTPAGDAPPRPARLVLESSDPVLVNGKPVAGPCALVDGDQLRIGEAVLRFEGDDDLLFLPLKPITPGGTTVELPTVPPPAATPVAPPAEAPPAATPPAGGLKETLRAAGGKAWEKTKRLFRDVTGKRAREKAAAIERRDLLLKESAEAALRSGFPGPESEAAAKAAAAAQEAEKKPGVAAKGAAKLARDKADRALLKLGRACLEKAGADPAKAQELRDLDARVKDLS